MPVFGFGRNAQRLAAHPSIIDSSNFRTCRRCLGEIIGEHGPDGGRVFVRSIAVPVTLIWDFGFLVLARWNLIAPDAPALRVAHRDGDDTGVRRAQVGLDFDAFIHRQVQGCLPALLLRRKLKLPLGAMA